MKMIKKIFSVFLSIVIILGIVPNTGTTRVYAYSYNPDAAVAYAAAHWNDGNGKCAEFVSRCLQAGGLPISTRTLTNEVYDDVIAMTGVKGQWLNLDSNGWASYALNSSILSKGDIVISWCGDYGHTYRPHIMLCGGYKNGYASFYAHNSNHNNDVIPASSGICEVCGRKDAQLKAQVIHISGGDRHPEGFLDSVEYIGDDSIHVVGWAYDPDKVDTSIQVHVYIGGTSADSNADVHVLDANIYRTDVAEKVQIGGYHGFDAIIKTNKTGVQPVYVYGIDITQFANNAQLSESGKTVDIGGVYTSIGTKLTDSEFYAVIRNIKDNNAIYQNASGNVISKAYSESEKERYIWHFTKNTDGTYRINSIKNDYSLDCWGMGNENGTNIDAHESNESNAQKWFIYKVGSNYVFEPRCAMGSALDADGENQNVHLWKYSSAIEYQHFKLEIKSKQDFCSHSWRVNNITLQPTCTEKGIQELVCTICGATKTEYIEANGHLWSGGAMVIKHATCTEEGEVRWRCTSCGIYGDIEKTSALGGDHIPEDMNYIAPTCTSNGRTGGTRCSRCGATLTEPQIIKATGHKWDSGKVTKAATCTESGVRTYSCTECDVRRTEGINPTGHKSVTDVAIAATCTKDGKTAGSHCSVCGTVITAQQTVKATGHRTVTDTAVEATCTVDGMTEGSHCSICGVVITAQQTVKATGHKWDSGRITTQPSTTSTGIMTYTCTKCGITKTETVAKLEEQKILGVSYTTHIQSIGWQNPVRNGDLAGTVGDSKRLEAIKIYLENAPYSGDIEYRTHVQTYGWQNWVKNGALSGTSGQAKRLEAIQIRLTGEMAKHYDVYYRIQVQSFGWLGWAKNGEYSGSAGYAKRLEAIQIVLVEKGKSLDRTTLNKQGKITSSTKVTDDTAYVAKAPSVGYQTHVQTFGWQGLKINGEMSGTSGQSKRLEAIKINLSKPPYEGGIRYKTHIQSIGWQDWRYDGEMSGTSGQAKRLEAICIELTGEMAQHYDVYYRVHAQSYGWLGWAKNGANAGTAGLAKRLEGIQIVLVEKGGSSPGLTYKGITSNTSESYIEYKSSVNGYYSGYYQNNLDIYLKVDGTNSKFGLKPTDEFLQRYKSFMTEKDIKEMSAEYDCSVQLVGDVILVNISGSGTLTGKYYKDYEIIKLNKDGIVFEQDYILKKQ